MMRKLPTPPKYERYYYKDSDIKAANRYNKYHVTLKHRSRELVVYTVIRLSPAGLHKGTQISLHTTGRCIVAKKYILLLYTQ